MIGVDTAGKITPPECQSKGEQGARWDESGGDADLQRGTAAVVRPRHHVAALGYRRRSCSLPLPGRPDRDDAETQPALRLLDNLDLFPVHAGRPGQVRGGSRRGLGGGSRRQGAARLTKMGRTTGPARPSPACCAGACDRRGSKGSFPEISLALSPAASWTSWPLLEGELSHARVPLSLLHRGLVEEEVPLRTEQVTLDALGQEVDVLRVVHRDPPAPGR